jgi:hypothetical protein
LAAYRRRLDRLVVLLHLLFIEVGAINPMQMDVIPTGILRLVFAAFDEPKDKKDIESQSSSLPDSHPRGERLSQSQIAKIYWRSSLVNRI